MKIHNFSAGPSILPTKAIEDAAKSVRELNDIGLSLLEISHRSKDFINIIEEAQQLIRDLLDVSDEYAILFLQGGASLQFHMSALNFSKPNGTAGYIDTGTWSRKAITESEKVGNTITIASSEDKSYNYIPKNIIIPENIDYLHFTSNNTIYGTQFHSLQNLLEKDKSTRLICDMSSDIFSKKINVNNFDLIYAGAQKNLGPAGATLVIIKKESLVKKQNIPTYLNYLTHIDKDSMFNTPPVFSIYVAMLTLRWIKENGGLNVIEQRNQEKAQLIYSEIDRNSLFSGFTNTNDRSNMNVTFNLNDESFTDRFDTLCREGGISGIKGHRSIGGYRASMYNALNINSVHVLVDIMKTLEQKIQ